MVVIPSRWTGCSREARPEGLPEDREWSGGPVGGQGVVGRTSRRDGSGRETLSDGRETLSNGREALPESL